jgi:Tfp pilus assembly protein PilF
VIVRSPVSDNQARNVAVQESSAAPAADRQSKPAGAAESIRPVNVIVGSPVSDNQARNAAVQESSATPAADRQSKPAGDGMTVTSVAAITPALLNTASAGNEKVSVKNGAEEEPKSAAINLSKPTAKISAGVSSTESSVENKEIKSAKGDETSSTPVSSTRPALSSTTKTSGSSIPTESPYQRGLRYLTAGAHEKSVEALNESIRLDPNDAITYVKLGLAYSALGKYKEAVVGLKMAIRIKPEVVDAEAYYHLGYSYSKLGKHKDALEAFKQALYVTRAQAIDKDEAKAQSSPTLGKIHYSLGIAYHNLARDQEAIKELNEAVKLNPKLAEAYYGLAIAYISLGDRSSAQRLQRTLISLNAALAQQLADALSNRAKDLPCNSRNSLQCR